MTDKKLAPVLDDLKLRLELLDEALTKLEGYAAEQLGPPVFEFGHEGENAQDDSPGERLRVACVKVDRAANRANTVFYRLSLETNSRS